MKAKKFEKLSLNKATIANLNNDEMESVHGGADTICQCTYRMCTARFSCDTEYDCWSVIDC